MLNKELMMTSCGPEAHVLMTVEEVFDPVGDMDRYHAGWIEGECASKFETNRINITNINAVDREGNVVLHTSVQNNLIF